MVNMWDNVDLLVVDLVRIFIVAMFGWCYLADIFGDVSEIL